MWAENRKWPTLKNIYKRKSKTDWEDKTIFGIQAICNSKPEWKLYSWEEIRLLNSTDIVTNFISSTKNRRRGQLTTVYGTRTFIRGTQLKKLSCIKGIQKFVSQQVILYKISFGKEWRYVQYNYICTKMLSWCKQQKKSVWWPKENWKRKFTDNKNQEKI